MSDTPRTDGLVLQDLKRPVEDAHDHLLDHARRLERELTLAEGKLAYLRSQRAGEMGEKLYQLEQELAERDAQLMRWFKAASPYATPGSLEEGLKKLERALVEAHPECRCHECTAIWERRYPTKP